MKFFASLPIKSKMLALIMLTSSVALILALGGFVTHEWLSLRSEAERDVRTQARILAANLGAAVAFEDSQQIRRVLQVLSSRPEFEVGWVFSETGEILATYQNPAAQFGEHGKPGPQKTKPFGSQLTVRESIEYGGASVGEIALQARFDPMRGRFGSQVELALLLLMLCWMGAFWLASRLRHYITDPIHALLSGIEKISTTKDFSVRVEKQSNDEFGQLVDGFNTMLEHIQQRDSQLQKARDELELRVAERTSALELEIAERKRVEAALAEEKERLTVMLRSIGEAVIATDCAGRITLFNPVAEKLTGISAQDAIGKSINQILLLRRPSGENGHVDLVHMALENQEANGVPGEAFVLKTEDYEMDVECTGAPMRDKNGHVVGVVFVLRDVTEKRRAAEELIRASKLESISLLAGGIAHDFNNILTAIMGNLSILRIYGPKLGELIGPLKQAEQAAHRAGELTRQLAIFAKGGVSTRKPVDLRETIEETIGFVLHGSKVAAKLEVAKDLWPVKVDEVQVRQAIQNVALNAVQAMADGGTLEVCASNVDSHAARQLGLRPVKHVSITVRDTGPGIQPKDLPRIFEPYFTTKKTGSGLGLAVAYSIIRRHDGDIRVESTVGRGTTFYLYLPATDEKPVPSRQKPEEPVPGRGRILVMDDEEPIRALASAALRRLGYDVETVADGSEAIESYKKAMAEKRPFTAVILDLTIRGGMGGGETIRRLRAIDPQVRAIVSSGYSEDAIMANYREHGFVAAIEKPYRLQELSQVLQHVTDGVFPVGNHIEPSFRSHLTS